MLKLIGRRVINWTMFRSDFTGLRLHFDIVILKYCYTDRTPAEAIKYCLYDSFGIEKTMNSIRRIKTFGSSNSDNIESNKSLNINKK